MFANRWPNYYNYEICHSFFSCAKKLAIVIDGKKTFLWDALVEWMQAN